MITELEELVMALRHQAHACYLSVENKRRVHAPTVLGLQADLEAGLALRNQAELLKGLSDISQACLSCIRITALTGRAPRCITQDLPEFEQKVRSIEQVKWQRIQLSEATEAGSGSEERLLKKKR